jgi:hypothetical protein
MDCPCWVRIERSGTVLLPVDIIHFLVTADQKPGAKTLSKEARKYSWPGAAMLRPLLGS